MMSSKSTLKAIRIALDTKDFEFAAEKATALVQQEPRNYHANVFLGLAKDKLDKNIDAEKAYLAAIRVKDGEKTAWQGLISLYEKQGSSKLDSYRDAVLKLGQILIASGEQGRCQDVVDKYIAFTKRNGTRLQVERALELHLPTSPLYSALEGRIPHPSHTFLRLIEIAESEEKQFINREIGERRTRLGARIDQVTREVKLEALRRSKLEELYQGIIDWSHEDKIRRVYEEKLLERGYELLQVLPFEEKATKREEVFRAARDMVIIKHPFNLAWKIALEWYDAESFIQWDLSLLNSFIEYFPDDGLSKVLKGFLASDISPLSKEPLQNKQETHTVSDEDNDIAGQDYLILMVEGLDAAPSSIVAHRIMCELYLYLEEYDSVVDVARKGLRNIRDLVTSTGIDLGSTSDAVSVALANALIHYQSPRNHPEAKGIFQSILKRKPASTSCLLGIGLILEADEDFDEAVDFLERAMERDPENVKIRAELSWSLALKDDLESGLSGLQNVLNALKDSQSENRALKSEVLYRIGYCQWRLDPSPAARKDRNRAYKSFLASIQSNMNYAPAYTSLGIYYADYKRDKARARRCFHKAFELSTSEIEAAERLAKMFADQKEWDLVEAVAQRAVDSGKVKPAPGSKRKGYSWPYAALGAVQISRQQYAKSIVSFQAALRISANDYHCWVGLGESYQHSGRYIAATKAFEHAQILESDLHGSEREQIWFARYMLANVRRELADYDDAITRYEEVLAIRPGETGVLIALLQTLVESSRHSIEAGLFNNGAELAQKAIHVATSLAQDQVDIFNLWKAIGDICSNFSYVKAKANKMPISDLKILLGTNIDNAALDILTDIDEVGRNYLSLLEEKSEGVTPSNVCMYASIVAHKRAIHASIQDTHAQAISWYNLGWAEYRAYHAVESSANKSDKRHQRKFLKAALRCFKRAIELEAGNAEFWNSLGVVTTSMSPKVAQHSFVRSLHLNDRSAQTWTNLGVLYLMHNDIQLANKAFTRAQSTDPDYPFAWVGQGFLALLFGDPNEARELFEHAFDIANSAMILPKQQYALTAFDHLLRSSSTSSEVTQLIQPLFALYQLRCQAPSDLSYIHLSCLLAERMGEFSDAEYTLQSVCTAMEKEYEVSESTSSLSKFAHANADSARVLLANHKFEAAAAKAEIALTLSEEEDAERLQPDMIRKLRLSAHLTAGLSHYYLKSMDHAIDMFRDALQEADGAPELVCLLAQVLWAKGGEEERSVARQQLFDCVERYPDHIGAVILLGAIGVLDEDTDILDAVESDLHSMITRDDIEIHDRARLFKLLAAISTLGHADGSADQQMKRVGEATAAVMRSPDQPYGWMELSAATQELYPAEIAAERAERSVPPRGRLSAADLAEAYAQTGRARDSLNAIMVAPWRRDGWEELSYIISGPV